MTGGALVLFGLAGGAAGVLAGLFGIGGGAVLVPLLYVLLEPRVPGESLTVTAHATSLAVIVPTAASALLRFQRSGLVPWRVVAFMGSGAAAGALATTRLVPHVPAAGLRTAFGVFLTAVGVRLLRSGGRVRRHGGRGTGPAPAGAGPGSGSVVSAPARPGGRRLPTLAGGVMVGAVSAALGVGGGALAIPLLLFVEQVEVRRVAAASMGVVAGAAMAGTAGYLLSEPPSPPPGTVGWIHLPAVLGLVPGAVVGARWGADLNARLPVRGLRLLFGLLLLAVAVRIFFVLLSG